MTFECKTTAKRLRDHEDGTFSGGKKCRREGCSDRRTILVSHTDGPYAFKQFECDYHGEVAMRYALRHGEATPENVRQVFPEALTGA